MNAIYSLDSFSTDESAAIDLIDKCDIIVNVIDATNLERNLNLTVQLLSKRIPAIVCLNFWDDTAHKGIALDVSSLETTLGVPVKTTSARSGQGVTELVASLGTAPRGKASWQLTKQTNGPASGPSWNGSRSCLIATIQFPNT